MAVKAPRGTQDILPGESYKWQFVENLLRECAERFSYGEIRTPMFESIDLFCRGVGDTTDVVQKEMYEVKAQKGTDIYALRPEGTASVVRTGIERGLFNDSLPQKLFYIISCFRHERPQAGRLREFHQFGCECFGAQGAAADVEMISLVCHVIELVGLKGLSLHVNSIGCPICRNEYNKKLTEFFENKKDKLCTTCLERLYKNPMRILDCKCPECQALGADAPLIKDHLCEECSEHFEQVKERLSELKIDYIIDPKIVRGLDYYTKTVFEFISDQIGAQGTVFAGGRYDGLVSQLGGKPTPALGFAMGIERLLLVMESQGVEIPKPKQCDLYIGSMGEAANKKACVLAAKLRAEGFIVECDLMDRSVKAQMKYANKIGALMSMVLGDSELESKKAKIKDMQSGEEKEIDFENGTVNVLYDAMLAREAEAIANQIGSDAFGKIMKME